jgi:hypothetical protein
MKSKQLELTRHLIHISLYPVINIGKEKFRKDESHGGAKGAPVFFIKQGGL